MAGVPVTGSPVLSLAASGFDAALLLGAVGFLLERSGGEHPRPVIELRFIACHCDRPGCSGVRRTWAPAAVT